MNDNVIVVGGGNAGCISALILKSTFPENFVKVIRSWTADSTEMEYFLFSETSCDRLD